MSNAPAEQTHSTAAQKKLQEYAHRMQDPSTAQDVWNRLLNPEERTRLRSLHEAYENGRTIGIWMTAKNVTRELAIIELARAFGLPDIEYFWLLRELGQSIPIGDSQTVRPVWNSDRGELRWKGEVIRRVSARAKNVRPILDTFEELGWPHRIDDPNPPGKLGNAVKRLNDKLTRIRFERDGRGEGISWRLLDEFVTS